MKLTGQQLEQLSQALRGAFNLQMFDETLRVRLEKNREDIALGNDFQAIAFRVIERAEMEGWVAQLILAARGSNPGNAGLLALAQQFGLAPINTPAQPALERIINEANSFLDVAAWRERLGQIEVQVCRVEIQGKAYGTGFLLGPDIVITNYHVVDTVINEEKGHTPEDIILRFDYKCVTDGTTLNPGTEYRVCTPDWLIDYSPFDPVDLQSAPKQGVPQPDRLDYALLRIHGEPGSEPIGKNSSVWDVKRGWIEVPTEPHDFKANPALYIVQHPKGKPLKLALDTEAVLDLNQNKTRVTYRTSTEPGSSGSPCFNQDWELVALHHGGDPELTPMWNEGIPFTAIMALLKEHKLQHVIGDQELSHSY